ncbi:golgin subfamily A member 6-like protein 7 [Plodia interpunctella]|uniref:golgin subfamily A member 6-like protein 7 n=1 Tax=Plodia interpunctella TaxID=58824 RepID=UPI0023678891|nr:golgin subfamily A member 6-like protein 7 [Plodia interpunctella]
MERAQAFTVENFISNWNGDFPNYPLTAADLKNPQALMGALFQVFDRLAIDRDAILMPPSEENRNEHMMYYADLIPVINMTRVINHLVSVMPQVDATISIMHFLQPTTTTSHSILLLLFNLMVFNEERLRDIAPHEEELFAKSEEVKALDDKRNRLIEMLNIQAEEKGKRAERLEKLDQDIKQLEEELKQEKEIHDVEKQELEAVLKENHQIELVLEQKKTQRDALLDEVSRKKALRVYDADDIRAQAQQAAQNVQEADEKLNSLKETLMQKEFCLKNLQTIKPGLDEANNLLHEIMKLNEGINEEAEGAESAESAEGELEPLRAELAELRAAREAACVARRARLLQRRHHQRAADSALREAEEKDRKSRSRSQQALQRCEEIKQNTAQYDAEKTEGMKHLQDMKIRYTNMVKTIDDALLAKALEVKISIEEKLRNRN